MSEQAQGVVTPEQDGQTLAAVVRALLGGVPWSRARKLCAAGRVQREGEPVTDPAVRVQTGETIHVVGHAQAAGRHPPIMLRHVDRDLVVVEKPAGLCCVPYQDERDTLLHRAHAALRRHEKARHLPPLRVVQRLDKDTSGVMVFARTRRAERGLGDQLRRHDVERRYLALAYGVVPTATHDTWLVPDRGDRRRGSWVHRGRGSRPRSARRAITYVQLEERFEAGDLRWIERAGPVPGISLVSCTLKTGRQHQIRIHLGESGHPLVGERVYARDYDGPRLLDFVEGRGRPMLHAATLGFVHPTQERPMAFDSELPSDFADLLRQLRAEAGPDEGLDPDLRVGRDPLVR